MSTATERQYNELRVRLVGYPTRLGLRADEQVADWLREFKLIAFASEGESEPTAVPAIHRAPKRLLQLAEQLSTVYATEVSEPDRQRSRALSSGQATVDIEFRTMPETESVALAWQDVIRQVDEFCRADELLTLARPPELVEFGDWVIGEFLRQINGEEPKPWIGPLA